MVKALELFYYFFQGIIFFQVVALAIFYGITRRKDSLYFLLFLFFAGVNFFMADPELFYNMKDAEVLDSKWFRFLNTPFAMLSGLFFTCFLKEFFSDLLNYPLFEKILTILIKLLKLLFIPFYILFFLNIRTELIFNIVNFFGLAVGAWLVYIILNRKIQYASIVAYGTILYLIGSLFTTYLLIIRLNPTDNFMAIEFPFAPLKLGILIQSFCYLIAIFNKWHHQTIIEKTTAVLNERDRISAELHDELGSSISGISLYSFLAQKQWEAQSNQVSSSLEVIQNNSKDIVDKLKDIIWINNRQNENFLVILQRLASYLNEMAKTKHCIIHTKFDDTISKLNLGNEMNKHIYLICKEAINNTIKYSEANDITFEIYYDTMGIHIVLKDNGKGFDTSKITGNGIPNMQRRAKDIGAILHLNSEINRGTEMKLYFKFTH